MKNDTYRTYKPFSNILTLPVWDPSSHQEVWVSKRMSDWIKSPGQINLAFFGLHILNTLRDGQGLKPLETPVMRTQPKELK